MGFLEMGGGDLSALYLRKYKKSHHTFLVDRKWGKGAKHFLIIVFIEPELEISIEKPVSERRWTKSLPPPFDLNEECHVPHFLHVFQKCPTK